jgi:hypothetical protein
MKVAWVWATVVSVLLPVAVRGQEKPPAAEKPAGAEKPAASPAAPAPERARRDRVNRVIKLRNRDLLNAFQRILQQFQINVTTSEDLGVIVLSGSPEGVAAAEDAIARFDRPTAATAVPRNLSFTAHLLVGRHQESATQRLPAELAPVIEQFRGVFAYKGYELLDTLAIRVAESRRGDSTVEGVVRWPAGTTMPARTHLRIADPRITAEDEKGRSIRIPKLTLKVDLPVQVRAESKEAVEYRTTYIETGLDIREGQKVVVGKASFDGGNEALILVLKVDVEG